MIRLSEKLVDKIVRILEDEFVNPNHKEVAARIVNELDISQFEDSMPLQYYINWAFRHVVDKGLEIPTRETFPEHLMHIVSEAGEADNAWLINKWEGKDGVHEELSDMILRLFGLVAHLKIPLEAAMHKKMVENDRRPKKHGKVNA